MLTTIYEPERLTSGYEPVNGHLDVEAGGVVKDTGTVGVLAVERGIELRIEEKIPKGDSEALGDAARMFVSTWQALAGIILIPEEARGLIRILTRAVAVWDRARPSTSRPNQKQAKRPGLTPNKLRRRRHQAVTSTRVPRR